MTVALIRQNKKSDTPRAKFSLNGSILNLSGTSLILRQAQDDGVENRQFELIAQACGRVR
jgi:hypothetical protein